MVKRVWLDAKSGSPTQEDMLSVRCQLGKLHPDSPCTACLGQAWASIALALSEAHVGKRQGLFLEPLPIRAGVPALSSLPFAREKLTASSWWGISERAIRG